jgi:hypothetical protein
MPFAPTLHSSHMPPPFAHFVRASSGFSLLMFRACIKRLLAPDVCAVRKHALLQASASLRGDSLPSSPQPPQRRHTCSSPPPCGNSSSASSVVCSCFPPTPHLFHLLYTRSYTLHPLFPTSQALHHSPTARAPRQACSKISDERARPLNPSCFWQECMEKQASRSKSANKGFKQQGPIGLSELRV